MRRCSAPECCGIGVLMTAAYMDASSAAVRVLVPGAGLGRLAYDIAKEGGVHRRRGAEACGQLMQQCEQAIAVKVKWRGRAHA